MTRVLLLVIIVLSAFGCEPGGGRNVATTKPGAPPGAKFLDTRDDPRDVYFAVMSAPPADRAAVEKAIIGLWIPKPGWGGRWTR